MTDPSRRDGPVGGGLWVVASVLVPNAYVLVLSVAVDHQLGAAGLGRQSLIAFVSAAATTLAGAGGFVAVVRAIGAGLGGGDVAAARRVARWGLRLHGATGVVAGAVVAAPVLWGVEPRAAWLLAALVTVLATVQMLPMAVLVGAQRWRDANVVGMATGAVAVPASIAVLAAGGGIEGLFAVEAVVVTVNLAWAGLLAHRALAGPAGVARPDPVDPADDRARLRFAALSAVGVAVTVVVWRRSELVILSWLSTDEEVARYSVAFAASAVLLTLSERFAAALTAPFSGLVHRGETVRLGAARGRAVRLLVIATLPVVGCAAGLGPAAIRVLYGDEYERSGVVLLVMLTTMAALPVWTVSAAVLAAHGDARSPLLAGAGAVVVDVALSVPLVAAHGALGAALASVGGQVTAISSMHLLARRRAGPTPWDVDSMGRALAVAAVAGGCAWWVAVLVSGPLGLAGAGLAGLVALVVAGGTIRPLTRADASWLAGNRGGRLGPHTRRVLERFARAAGDEADEEAADATTSS